MHFVSLVVESGKVHAKRLDLRTYLASMQLFIAVWLVIGTSAYCQHMVVRSRSDESVSKDGSPHSSGSKCPLWHIWENETCVKGNSHYGIIRFDENSTLWIKACYCMSYGRNGSGLFIGACFSSCYALNTTHLSKAFETVGYRSLPKFASQLDLEDILCKDWGREGFLCGNCKPNHAPLLYSYELRCLPCDSADLYINILKYILYAFVPLTLFLLLLLCCQINIMTAKLNAFIFVSQIIASSELIRVVLNTVHSYHTALPYTIVIKVLFSLYGIWNLDFFKTFSSNICVSSLTPRAAQSLEYVVAAYPFLFLSLLYFLVKLYDRGCRFVVLLWHPFHMCFFRHNRMWKIHTSLLNTFIALLFLTYTKLLSTQLNVFQPTLVYNDKDNLPRAVHLYIEPTVNLFYRINIFITMMGLLTGILFTFLPIVFLCICSTRCGQRCLNYCWIRPTALQAIRDAFQGYFKDGTGQLPNYRFFSVAYLLARLALFSIYAATPTFVSIFIIPLFLILLAIFVIALKPYKQEFSIYNQVDPALILILAFMFCSMMLTRAAQFVDDFYLIRSSIVLCAVFTTVPQAYFFFLLLHWFIKHAKVTLNNCRRRSYTML